MHSANIGSSSRLQRVERLLRDGREYSTLAISRKAHVMAVSAVIAEMRENGRDIQCTRRGQVWYYRMAKPS